jgi:tRNA(fMet)-specific endonuclease VapC
MVLDTVVLIDLERELRQGKAGRATTALERHANETLFLTPTIAGELAAGESMNQREVWRRFIEPFTFLAIDERVCWQYGELYRKLRSKGRMIGANDLWIAATTIAYEESLLSRNEGDFHQVPGLKLLTY